MNRIPKCRSKYYIPQQNNIKPSQKESIKENIPINISKKNIKFTSSRHFGKDITNNMNQNTHSIYNNNNTKMVTIIEKRTNNNVNNNIYIKKHSSASQVAAKNKKNKNIIIEKKLRENKSGSVINKKNDPIISEYYHKNSNLIKQYPPQAQQPGSKLHSSISFGFNGMNGNMRPITSNNNTISVRLSIPKNNSIYKVSSNYNNRSINNYNNNLVSSSNNTKNELNHNSNMDIM